MPTRRFCLGLAISLLLAGAAYAGQPVTITNPQNSQAAVVDSSGLHVVCDSGCSGGGGGGGAITAASGSYASGALSAGAIVDLGTGASPGANTTNGILQSAVAAINAAVPAGPNIIGKVGVDQTTPGTTNGVALTQIGSTTTATGNGATSAGTQRVTLSMDNTSVAVDVSTATTTQIIAASGSTVVHVQHWTLVGASAQTVKWVSADTGGSCANPVALTGVMSFAANGGAAEGSGVGDVLVAPSGKAVCLITSQAVQTGGSIAYRQF